jgi:hypothetical protein
MLNPNLAAIRQNIFGRMLPLARLQVQVYRMADGFPPGLEGYAPKWECVSVVLPGKGTQQMRVALEKHFHLLAFMMSSANAGGARAQLYDPEEKVRFGDRNVTNANLAGGLSSTTTDPFFLREPYLFGGDAPTVLLNVQNMDAAQNAIQIVLYGMCLRKDQAQP